MMELTHDQQIFLFGAAFGVACYAIFRGIVNALLRGGRDE